MEKTNDPNIYFKKKDNMQIEAVVLGVQDTEPSLKTFFSFKEMQEYIGGGYIEIIIPRIFGVSDALHDAVILADEEGFVTNDDSPANIVLNNRLPMSHITEETGIKGNLIFAEVDDGDLISIAPARREGLIQAIRQHMIR